MRIGLVQSTISWGSPEKSILHYRTLLAQRHLDSLDLLAFPEMFTSGFCFSQGEDATRAYRIGTEFLSEIAQSHGVFCAGSLPEIVDDPTKPFNSLLVFDPSGSCCARYRKMHLFSYAGEHERASAGESLKIVTIAGVRIALFVCYDLRFPQAFAAVGSEVDAFLVVANWPAARRMHWDTLLRARAIENQAYVLGVNRVGEGGGVSYDGGTCLINPEGGVQSLKDETEDVLESVIEVEQVSSYRSDFPTLRDRRPERYHL